MPSFLLSYYSILDQDFALPNEDEILPVAMRGLGSHWLVDFYECQRLPNDRQALEAMLVIAAEKAGATVVQSCFHQFSPYGLSGVVVIAESHLAGHTWPEHRAMCIDFFSCSSKIDATIAIAFIASQVQAARTDQRNIVRGSLLEEPL